MYKELRVSFGVDSEINQLRKQLTPTHFWTMWDLRNKYNIPLDAVYWYLVQIFDYKSIGQLWSAVELRREVEAHENKSGNVPGWDYYRTRLHNFVANLSLVRDLPQAVARWIADAPPEVKEPK
jgi:hypothetical protein